MAGDRITRALKFGMSDGKVIAEKFEKLAAGLRDRSIIATKLYESNSQANEDFEESRLDITFVETLKG